MERFKEKMAIAVAWALPRRIAYWAFIRVTTEGCEGNPSDQAVTDIQKRWSAA